MPQERRKQLLPIFGLVAVIGLVGAVVVFNPGPKSELSRKENPPSQAEGATGENPEVEAEAAEEGLGGWGSFGSETTTILIRAEEAENVTGNMELGTADDNEKVLNDAGERASTQYVGAPDNSCGKDAKPSANAAVFQTEIDSAGTYYPWVRVWWKDSCGDSLGVVLQQGDGKEVQYVVTDGTHKWWHWLPIAGAKGVELQKGQLTVRVENREDGARLGRILFATRDYESYMPSTPEG
jgi:hypothetical protein